MNVQPSPRIGKKRRRARTVSRLAPLAVLLAALGSTSLAPAQPAVRQPLPRLAQAAAPLEPVAPLAQPPGAGRTHKVSLRQLGAVFPLQLRGVQGSSGVQFGVRGDEVVTEARLHLNYAYSPALLPDISHIRVLVNEQVVETIPVPREQGGESLQRTIEIPTRLIGEFNRLNLELIGHYTMECEDPAHTSLWANVGNDSVLELSVNPLALPNDLSFLPEPFFDRRDARQLVMPIVFARVPDAGQLEAAGTIASWFGGMAGFRGASFPASVGQLPARGNAIVLSMGGGEGIAGVPAAASSGPTITMATHPNDPTSKLLIISGRDAVELKRAATALAVGGMSLSGPSASIGELKEIAPRKPYDAPNWLASDRAVKFGELVDQSQLTVSGYSPDLIRVNFQVPPDLFAWRKKDIPVHLKYRYTARPMADKSTLNVGVNEQFLRALPLRAMDHERPSRIESWLNKAVPPGDLLPAEDKFDIPLFKLPARSQLQFHYYHDIQKEGLCKDVLLDNVRGTVEPDSTIDIRGFSHFLAMPDLAAFANTGFPFTRMADLSETAIVLPARPEAGDYSAYLSLMGLMGTVTGYPAHSATVVLGGERLDGLERKDLLVIASGSNPPLVAQWAEHLPFSLKEGTKRFRLSDYASHLLNWFDPEQRDRSRPGRSEIVYTSASSDAIYAGFESPLRSGRSVVLLVSNQASGLQQGVDALLDPDLLKRIQGSTAVIRGKQVDSLVAEQTYHVGQLNPVTRVQWWLSRNPLALIVLGVVAAALVAFMLYIALRARARRRLRQQKS
ncbi:cellulose biosynthesis cyclic di-GMP-binding regulatory protein BcsB [Melaminivora jejuensis]|uniref:cellulose biosynthesis cyclic di-GMP-binding regulatory protein BcsB n=1 Tax=Melaminivora jejuensis TaxID=1267217 RepID=UPI001ADECDD9|nr:cellulose biosynthesis cyclic di-GMP-binding regulatory protein BcsB [Melaminivora jejuensis]UHJ64868.1 cellulose biosynthesis cyclic di-GMP-binding regulatory protein BcsB [Melaminivora jejuensis]